MDSREVLEREIEQLEAQLKPRKAALAALKKLEAVPQGESSPATRFFNMRPLVAAVEVLQERGRPMPKVELRQILLDGGIAIGKKRAVHNVDVGLRLSVEMGKLTSTGKEEMIGLPEWSKKR